nr:uncharacterized protein LOC109191526 [Ipomoea trifida]
MKPEEGYDHTWILKPTASQSLNTIEDFQTRERRAEEENKPSDGEQLMPVLDSLKRAEEENKPSDGGFRSASTKKRSNSGETPKKRKRKCSPSEKNVPFLLPSSLPPSSTYLSTFTLLS